MSVGSLNTTNHIMCFNICIFIPDCKLPMGIENNKLDDSAFTATSQIPNHPPNFARLSKAGWCGSKGAKNSTWLKIDLGKVGSLTLLHPPVENEF